MQSNNSQYNYRKTYLLNVTSSSFFDLFLPMLKIRSGLKFQWLFALVSLSAWRLALDRDCVLNNSSVRILRFCFFTFRWHPTMISFLFFLFCSLTTGSFFGRSLKRYLCLTSVSVLRFRFWHYRTPILTYRWRQNNQLFAAYANHLIIYNLFCTT